MNVLDPILPLGQVPRSSGDPHGAGFWTWFTAERRLVWSAGLFHLLGLSASGLRPDLRLLLSVVHPDDRDPVEAAIGMDGVLPDACTFRVVHPCGAVRVLWTRTDAVAVSGGGPVVVSGALLDVTEAGSPDGADGPERRGRRVLIEQTRTLLFSRRPGLSPLRTPSFESLFEPSAAEMAEDDLAIVAAEHREECRAIKLDAERRGVMYHGIVPFRMAGGGHEVFRCVVVPVRDAFGAIVEWFGLVGPTALAAPAAVGPVRLGLEQSLRGYHLRAARGLLDWSMSELAAASGLSLSTVRRLEDDGEHPGARSRHKAVAALRGAGIRFVALDNGALAVALV
ncbi:PAS domain-containing protein [uncultured Methylobacterium sp.]|jgi:hypothetical protein|uniref:PAS domain-containing protein n=1 Tax=uncultured Methylobacterium sp. TaxID=157278 RepID=UPI002619295B|nr:PAS domain-containing protein [uncultured Methylobacterium sp.]